MDDAKIGSVDIDKIYIGNTLWWQRQLTPSYVIFDDFTRADSTTEIGTATSGHTWNRTLEPNTIFGILGGQLYVATTAGVRPLIFIDDGLVTKKVSIDFLVNASQPRLVFRILDINNYFSASFTAAGAMVLAKTVGGTTTTLATISSAATAGNLANLLVEDNGSTIKVYVNNNLVSTVNSQTDLNTNTKAGIRLNTSDSTSQKTLRADNYKVEAL